MQKKKLVPIMSIAIISLGLPGIAPALESPDHQLKLVVTVTDIRTATYAISRNGRAVLLPSPLGVQLAGADFGKGLTLLDTSPVRQVADDYRLAVGKRKNVQYRANEQVYTFANDAGQKMDIVFRVSNDGVAFRYIVAEPALLMKTFVDEVTGFAFAPATRAFLQPMSIAKTGFARTNPSYEEYYLTDIPVGTPSPLKPGWVFPALFKSGDDWVALSEANMDGSFHASRLRAESPDGVYRIGLPAPEEVIPGGKLLAETTGTMKSPWRIIATGSLETVMNSTLGTDLAAPQAVAFDPKLVRPGHASWSWGLLKDDYTVFDVQKKFIDYAADMKWDYTLIDADWDRKIGYDKVKELVRYAAGKGVGILLWYNSAGSWNDTEYTPRGKLLTPASRTAEFARLRHMGVRGVKIDFFGGDGQSMIHYYVDILEDAAAAGLLVNFHGATLPRGWQRTYPNLMTAEAIRGLEYATFEQANQDKVVRHAATAPFTRNLFDPMDFTPMVFGDIPNIKRRTRNGFELAESVLFLSGIQHFAEIPEGMATAPAYVKDFLRRLPAQWDDSRFLAGYPGSHVVIARKAGTAWYVAGINADAARRTLTLDLSFVGDGNKAGILIADGKGGREFSRSELRAGKARVTLQPHGGFVAVFK